MDEEAIRNMRARVAQCRRLADQITDERAAAVLRQMADQGEADLWRLEADRKSAS